MSSAATNDAGLLQPDYSNKAVTFLKDVILKAISFVDIAANGNKFLLYKAADGVGSDLGTATALIKSYDPVAADDWEVAFCLIAEPGVVDLQKDVWSEDEIRKAAHQFLADGGLLNHQHQDLREVGQLVESYVAIADMEIPTPDGKSVLVKKGSWLIGVRPNAEMKKKIMRGEITGMSVQGSAQRVTADEEAVKSFIEKADKDNRAIPRKAGGEGIKRIQHLLGTEETEEYDDATEAALMAWMEKKGVPGLPTLATLKFLLSDQPVAAPAQAAPVAGPAVEQLAPLDMVDPPREEAEKDAEPYNPATTSNASDSNVFQHDGANVGAQPGSMGLRVQDLTPDSPADDLKAALYQSVQEGNEALTAYLQEHAGGASSGDLYGTDLSQPELWFMYSKFVGGARPMIDAAGDLVTGQQVEKEVEPEVEKGAWTGSHGGHDPDAHKGNAYNFVRTFGEWAHGKQSVAAKKLLANGVVKTPEAADRLCFVAGTLVETKLRGQVEIENLIPFDSVTGKGDWVRTHKGHFRPVVSVVANKNHLPLYTVTSELNDKPIQVTENHNLLVARGAEFRGETRTRKRSREALLKAGIEAPVRSATDTPYPKQSVGTVEWADVQDINEHDYLLFPKAREVVDRPEVSDDFLWLVGMYAAEGSGICRTGEGNPRNLPTKFQKRTAPLWSFDIEEPLVAECVERLEREFGLKARVYRGTGSDVVGVWSNGYGSAVAVTDQLATAISGNQWTKRFADWILALPEDRLRIVLDAYWAGDGHIRPHRSEAVATTVSRDLAYQIRQMLVYLGERPSLRQCREKRTDVIEGRVVNGSDTWSVSYNPNKARRNGLETEDYIAFPVRTITKSEAPEWVYDVQVAGDNSLIAMGIVAHNSSWLKDQWMGSTKWRHGSVKKNDDFTHILKDMDAKPELLEALHAEDAEPATTSAVTKVTEILRAGGSADHIMGQINEALSNRPTGMDGAAPALKNAILQALEAPEDERDEMIDNIIEDFTRYAKHSALTKSDSFSKATAAEETNANPNNSPIGEEMDRAKIEENRDHLTAAAEFITSILDGQSHEVPAEVEKEVDEAEKPVVEDAPEAPEAKDDEATEAPDDLEAAAEEALEDEDEDVTEEELLRVLNHVVETMDSLEDRVAQLESLEKKLDQVGELAKALDVTGQIDVLNTQVSELTKALDAAVSSEEMEVVRKQLDDIASTPGAPSALPVDEARVAQPVVQEVAKSAPAQNNLWVGTFR